MSAPEMMNRKLGSGSGFVNATVGIDRGRVGERLQAALAGVQELHLLKERQSGMVQWALQMAREKPALVPHPDAGDPGGSTDEQRLEATLAALKEQLSRLRRQDVGLKSHLQQLDQQISELKLDMSKASSEHLESDSRPSSGFYDLSDGGSVSLSNSCTSVYSECLSSSQSSLLPSCQHSPPGTRPQSADEITVQGSASQRGGVRMGSRIRTSTDPPASSTRARPRPVSTGDLDRMVLPGLGFYKAPDTKAVPSLSHGINIKQTAIDPRYQSNLVSRNGSDVYQYPSPLHAVALQSPIFSLSGETATAQGSQTDTVAGATVSSCVSSKTSFESRPDGYIYKLLQHKKNRETLQPEGCCQVDRAQPLLSCHNGVFSLSTAVTKVNCRAMLKSQGDQSLSQGQPNIKQQEVKTVSEEKVAIVNYRQETVNCAQTAKVFHHREDLKACHSPLDADQRVSVLVEANKCPERVQKGEGNSCPDHSCVDTLCEAALSRKALNRKHSSTSSLEKKSHEALPQSEFVHAKFVPAGSLQVKVRQAGKKTKAVKLKRRSSEKLRTVKQLPCENLKIPLVSGGLSAETAPFNKHSGGRAVYKEHNCVGEVAGRSCSQSSLYPAHLRQTQQVPKFGPSTTHRLLLPEPRVSVDTSKKRQTRKWQSVVEISTKPSLAPFPNSRPAGHLQVLRKAGMMRSTSLRHRPSQYGVPRHPHPNSYSCLLSESEVSEYSAECASLFHSTIAESSEGELSDFTANRFGDSESSESSSDGSSDSSLSLNSEDMEDGELVWAQSTVGPTAAGLPLSSRPEPPACRIKASKALKKKIRRFQPAALKVMTMV
ncbi:dapper homolog 2 isoform X1 [Lepisosteus oculatus]|uniref:dapper homolog 2 isoform X1 n=1 Tax=Lepisosteus oculatus TaxID=7918 RepID=UPI0035F504C3